MITYDYQECNANFCCSFVSAAAIFNVVTTKKGFLAFRVSPELKKEIEEIAASEVRSVSQVCELLLSEGVGAYKKQGPKFMQRLVAKEKLKTR